MLHLRSPPCLWHPWRAHMHTCIAPPLIVPRPSTLSPPARSRAFVRAASGNPGQDVPPPPAGLRPYEYRGTGALS